MSTPERYELVHEIFTHACELTGDERRDYLDQACREVQDLREEIERMLAVDEEVSNDLDTPALGGEFDLRAMATSLGPDAKLVGRRLGRYHLKRIIASGGMGTVYEATQESPHRIVAVKVMKPGLASRSSLRRFEYEAQILARLRHPGVAQIFEAGTSDEADGLPYFVMEYVPGALPLTEYAVRKTMSLRDRLALLASVCDAVSHGHQKGIIHRDLKPANILVDAHGEVKVIDFGVARATDSDMALTTLQTDVGQLIGTLQYMSPEQCDADPHGLDTRSDVYSLGVVLYELLCGQTPYDVSSAAVHEAARMVREAAPARPSTINRTLRGDLETITLKALEKDRDRRYQSAADLAADIRRYLNDEPIDARPPSAIYQIRKFAKRHRAFVGSVAAIFLVLVIAVIVTSMALAREAEQRRLAQEGQTEAQRQQRIAAAINNFLQWDLLNAVTPDEQGHEVTMREALDVAAENLRGQFEDEPEVAAALHQTIGNTYLELGQIDKVEPHLVEAIRLYETSVGPTDPAMIQARTQLAGFYEQTSRFDEAEGILVPLLEISQRALGEEHLRTASILTELGHIQWARGSYVEAEEYHRRALPIYKLTTGERSDDVARCMSNLAMTLRQQMRYDEAEELYHGAIEIITEVRGPDHAQTLPLINNLGVIYYSTGRYELAIELFRDLVEKMQAVFPVDHPEILVTEMNLAINLDLAGYEDEALKIEEGLRPRMIAALGPADYNSILITNNLADSYREAGRLDEAEALLVDVIERIKAINPEHEYIAGALSNLAYIDMARGGYAEADQKYLEVFERLLAQYPEHHPQVMQHRYAYSTDLLIRWGQYERAETELLTAIETSREHYGDENPGTRKLAESLVALYEQWDRLEDAERWRTWLKEADAAAAAEPSDVDTP